MQPHPARLTRVAIHIDSHKQGEQRSPDVVKVLVGVFPLPLCLHSAVGKVANTSSLQGQRLIVTVY